MTCFLFFLAYIGAMLCVLCVIELKACNCSIVCGSISTQNTLYLFNDSFLNNDSKKEKQGFSCFLVKMEVKGPSSLFLKKTSVAAMGAMQHLCCILFYKYNERLGLVLQSPKIDVKGERLKTVSEKSQCLNMKRVCYTGKLKQQRILKTLT